jgi:hypothetical protein
MPTQTASYFTADNTEGFTAEELLHLNGAHAALVEFAMTQFLPTPDRSQVEKSTSDTLMNLWDADCWERRDLVYAALSR